MKVKDNISGVVVLLILVALGYVVYKIITS